MAVWLYNPSSVSSLAVHPTEYFELMHAEFIARCARLEHVVGALSLRLFNLLTTCQLAALQQELSNDAKSANRSTSEARRSITLKDH